MTYSELLHAYPVLALSGITLLGLIVTAGVLVPILLRVRAAVAEARAEIQADHDRRAAKLKGAN